MLVKIHNGGNKMCDLNHLSSEEHESLAKLIKELKQNFVRDYVSGFEEIVSSERKSDYHLREDTLRNEDKELYNIYIRTISH